MSQQVIRHPVPTTIAPKSGARWIVVAIVSVIVTGAIVWISISAASRGEPRLNEGTDVLAKFITSPGFDALPYEKQRQYYKVFDDRDKQIDQSFHENRLTEAQYRAALEAAWLGKHINRMEKYFALAPGQPRADYITGLLAKRDKRPGKAEHDKIEADESAAEMRVDHWPDSVRDQWNQFHAAYKKEKKAHEAPTTTRPQEKKHDSKK